MKWLLVLLLAACNTGKPVFMVTAAASSVDGGRGSVSVSGSGDDNSSCTTEDVQPCSATNTAMRFDLYAIPDPDSRLLGWECETGPAGTSPLIAIRDSWDHLISIENGTNVLFCRALFAPKNRIAELCADALGVAAQHQQVLDSTTDPFGLLPGVVGGGVASGAVIAERCDPDLFPVTDHSAKQSVPSKAPEKRTNTVVQATQVVEYEPPTTLDCNTPAHVAGACAAAVDFSYVYTWVVAEEATGLFSGARSLAPNDQLQFSVVFDTDGSPSNNYVPSSQYPADFWLGTDVQIAATYANGQWSLRKTVGPSLTQMPTNAVLFADGATLLWAIPARELGIMDGVIPSGFGVRTSLFRHGGDYGINPPHDWSGDVDPPVDQPLYSLP